MTMTSIKIIATVLMFFDHVASTFGAYGFGFIDSETTYLMRLAGRIAFPVFVFLIANGYRYTKDKEKYLFNMVAFGVISQIPYALALFQGNKTFAPIGTGFIATASDTIPILYVSLVTAIAFVAYFILSGRRPTLYRTFVTLVFMLFTMFNLTFGSLTLHSCGGLNVYYTLAFGLAGISLIDKFTNSSSREMIKYLPLVLLFVHLLAYISPHAYYGVEGALYIVAMYIAHKNKWFMSAVAIVFTLIIYNFGDQGFHMNTYTYSALLIIPIIFLYNGKRGRIINKYAFYAFYPAHLALIGVAAVFLRVFV